MAPELFSDLFDPQGKSACIMYVSGSFGLKSVDRRKDAKMFKKQKKNKQYSGKSTVTTKLSEYSVCFKVILMGMIT